MKLTKYPWLVRSLIIILSTFLLIISLYNFIGTSSSSTDENVFVPPVSRFYLTADIPVINQDKKEDTLHKGVFILSLNNVSLQDKKSNTEQSVFEKALSDKKHLKTSVIIIYDPVAMNKKTYIVDPKYLEDGAVKYMNSAVVVTQVFKNGASDKAGMLVGDVITSVNGKQFRDIFEADNMLKATSTNALLRYGIQRGDKELIIHIVPVKFGIPFINVIQLFISLFFLAFGVWLSIYRTQFKAAILVGIAHIGMFSLLALEYTRYLDVQEPIGVIRGIIQIIFGNLVCALFVHSTFVFPIENKEITKRRWTLWVIYGYASIMILLRLINVFIFNFTIHDQILYQLSYVCIAFYVFFRIKYRSGFSLEYKKLNRSIGVSFVTAFVFIIAFNFLVNQIPTIFENRNIFGWIRAVILLIPLSYLLTISKYKLLDTNIRIKKNIQYIFASMIWQSFALAVLLLLLIGIANFNITFPNLRFTGTNIEVINSALSAENQLFYQKIFLILITILFSIIGWKTRISILKVLDKKFHRISFDYRKATSELADILSKYLSIKDLTSTIVKEIADLAMLKKSGLIVFRNEETIATHDYYGVKNNELIDLLSSSGITLVQSIKTFKEPFRVDFLPDPHKQILKAFGFVHVLPIYSKNKLLGAALIGEKKAESSLNRADIEFLNTFSGQIAVAIDNSFMYEECTLQERVMHELEIARRIQIASLPDSIPNIEGLDISGTSIPAYEVGGDFYDFLETENSEFAMIIGDVSGKGTSAALYMSKIQGIIRTLHEFGLSPRQLLVRTNNILIKYLEKGYFISATIINFETKLKKAQFARAGHLPVYYYSQKTSNLKRIISKGMVLGLSKDKQFERNLEEEEIQYESGDVFVFVTDGITESKNNMMVEFGEDRLIDAIKLYSHLSAEEIRNHILRLSRDFASGEPQFDDMTVVVIKIP